MPSLDEMAHDTNCGGINEPIYPCADSYQGFNMTSMNLDMCKSSFLSKNIHCSSIPLGNVNLNVFSVCEYCVFPG